MSTTYINATTITVDDHDPNIIYTGGWAPAGSTNEYNQTTTGSMVDHPNCSFSFSFLGTAVEVHGTRGSQTVIVQFQVDDLPAVIFQTPVAEITQAYGVQFYSSGTLDAGYQNLTAKVMNEQLLWVDYLLYTPSLPGGGSGNSTRSTSSSSPPFPPSSALKTLPTSPSWPSLPSSASQSSSTTDASTAKASTRSSQYTGAIVGGVVGGFVALGTLVALLWWRRRRTEPALEAAQKPNFRSPSPFIQRRSSVPHKRRLGAESDLMRDGEFIAGGPSSTPFLVSPSSEHASEDGTHMSSAHASTRSPMRAAPGREARRPAMRSSVSMNSGQLRQVAYQERAGTPRSVDDSLPPPYSEASVTRQ